jgi:CO dehydrogenase nickel-insertion accessory protein CooC1
MTVSMCGRVGSGRGAPVTILADEVRTRSHRVLVLDSDVSNSGLFRITGFDQPATPLMELAGGSKGFLTRSLLGRCS